MASYNYPPPPPPPSVAQPASYAPYGQPYEHSAQRSGGMVRGRGGHHGGRGDFHGAPVPHDYNNHAQAYASPHPGAYTPQQWHPSQGAAVPPQQPVQAQMSNQNYHPNYAPHMYPQQYQYAPQPSYQQPAQPSYAQVYQTPHQSAPPPQQWAPQTPHQQPPHQQPPFSGGSRGRGGFHGDRPKGPVMGPQLRMGFENSQAPANHAAPVSSVQQPYGDPHGPPSSYQQQQQHQPPYHSYAQSPTPFTAGAGQSQPRYESSFTRGRGGGGGRGGHQNSFRGKPHGSAPHHGGGDRPRPKKPFTPNNNPTPQPPFHQKPDGGVAGKKKKRKTNTLGLTPGDDSSSEDDEDEEKRLSELIGAEVVKISDIDEWLEQRKRSFPTRARIEAKQVAEKAHKSEKSDEKALAKLEKQQQRAERLRKELAKVESSIKRKREQQDEGDEMRDYDDSSSGTFESKSDDERPETLSSRQKPPPARSNPSNPAVKADPTRHCKYFSTGGTCGKKGKCRFVHDEQVRKQALADRAQNGGRLTIKQRLILNDQDQEDLTVLKAIMHLKDLGRLDASSDNASAGSPEMVADTPVSQPERHQIPPKPQLSLPSHIPPPSMKNGGASARYQGWNLGGYGNLG